MVGDVLLGEDGSAGGDLSHHGYFDHARGVDLGSGLHLAAHEARRLPAFDHAEGAALQLPAEQVTLPLERLQMIVDAVGGTDAEVLADFADGRRVPLLLDAPLDEGEDLLLAFGQCFGHVGPLRTTGTY